MELGALYVACFDVGQQHLPPWAFAWPISGTRAKLLCAGRSGNIWATGEEEIDLRTPQTLAVLIRVADRVPFKLKQLQQWQNDYHRTPYVVVGRTDEPTFNFVLGMVSFMNDNGMIQFVKTIAEVQGELLRKGSEALQKRRRTKRYDLIVSGSTQSVETGCIIA